ncbi:MAG: tetratricopeptide repeat protein [Neisseria sp.]|uniref:heme biosynthesis protein HemY n=1 Tax=Neisseria sp. TaxID=192066 RepID=UPI0026DA7F1A|nr:tetratricopeptide repeat protein [Neisseria sp.]MDO4248441.1 tetratricopeptide repeat protein [Neisseria sp.]
MFFWKTRFRPVVSAVLLAFSLTAPAVAANVKGAETAAKPEIKASDYREVTKETGREQERQRRQDIVKRTNEIFVLMGGEMALQKGDAGTALATYMVMFDRSKDPQVAERAMDMAISLHAYEQAEAIYQKWREAEPVPGKAQRRMAWARSVTFGDVDNIRSGMRDAMSNADDDQRSRLFLLLAQAGVQRPGLAKQIDKVVHAEAKKYPDMPEAVITDAIYSAYAGDENEAIQALKRLSELDASILPATELTLRLIGQQQPAILNRFFAQTDTDKLSPMWQQIKLESMIHAGKNREAYALLQKLLAEKPDSDLYLQAAFLSMNQKDDLQTTLGYLNQAYKYGTQEQQSRAAVVAAMRNAEAKQFAQALEWADKIKSPDFVFDKAVLQASVNAEAGNWRQALEIARRARSLPEQQGRFFSDDDLLRVQLFAITKQNNPQQALQELNQLYSRTAKQPGNSEKIADILYQRAMVYADQLNDPQKAIADLRRYQELRPNTAGGMNALGYTLLSLPNPNLDESFQLIQAAYQQEPESAAINDSMGWVYFLRGETEAAVPYLEFAFKEYPDPEVAAHLGEVYWKLGRQEDAKRVFNQGLKQKDGKRALLLQTIRRLGVPVPAAK